jgi:peroxiredoxin Q/BCP
MLTEGKPFPQFSLPDQDGKIVTNRDLVGKRAVIYFYPKDDTSGCTLEACSFEAALPAFDGVPVYGVSPDPPKKHVRFRSKYGLTFTLLSDVDHAFIEGCGLWIEKTFYGRKYMGVARTTVLLDKDGTIAKLWRDVKPEGHAAVVQEALK